MKKLYFFVAFLLSISAKTNAQCNYFKTVVSGAYSQHTLAIKSDGTLWAWGRNNYGQLGNNSTNNSGVPIQIGTATNWVTIAASWWHSLGIKSDGTLWAWGYNASGELGDGTYTQSLVPKQIGSATNWLLATAGNEYSMAISTDGKLWGWGRNGTGQLGDGTSTDRNVPTQIGSATNWTTVSAGYSHTLGVRSDGTLWASGNNNYGELGDGTNTSRLNPTQIGTATNWKFASAGETHSLGLKADGTAWAWGYNSYGQLGDGTGIDRWVPTQVGSGTNWVNLIAGGNHSIGNTSDNKLWGWGSNGGGQLGDGTTYDRHAPILIGTGKNWATISCGFHHTMAMTSNGTLWACGQNVYGELGDGTFNLKYILTQIGSSTNFTGLFTTNVVSTMQPGQLLFFNNSCALIASVNNDREWLASIKSAITAKGWMDASQSTKFVKRHFEIMPATNSNSSTAIITLFINQQDFDAFNAVNFTKLPTGPTDVAGIANLLIEKRDGQSSDGSGLPSSYSGNVSTINPDDANIFWNAAKNWWEITFSVTGFGGFFVKTTSTVLPLQWLSVTGSVNAQEQGVIYWKVQENNVHGYSIEKSKEGSNFSSIGFVNSKGDGTNSYSFVDLNGIDATVFYRIKQTDKIGKVSYSNIIMLSATRQTNLIIYPNPVVNLLSVSNASKGSTFSLIDMSGKTIETIKVSQPSFTINMARLSAGMYLLKSTEGEVYKIIKQ